MSAFKVFVVDDDEWYRKLLSHTLSLNPDFEVATFESGTQVLESLKERPKLITLDYRLPDIKGEELFDQIKKFDPTIEIIMISEQQDIETAVSLDRKSVV